MGKRKYPKQGQIWICNFGINIGSEQNGSRPCIILNNPPKYERTCIVLPASRTRRLFSLEIDEYNFLIHQMRVVDTIRFKRIIKRIDKSIVDNLINEICRFLKQ